MWQNFLPHNAANSYKLITRDYFIFGFSFSGLQRSCFWPSFVFYTDVIVWLKQKSAYIPRPWHRSKGSPPWRQWSWEGRAHLSSWSRSEMSKRPWCPEKMKKNVVEVLFCFFSFTNITFETQFLILLCLYKSHVDGPGVCVPNCQLALLMKRLGIWIVYVKVQLVCIPQLRGTKLWCVSTTATMCVCYWINLMEPQEYNNDCNLSLTKYFFVVCIPVLYVYARTLTTVW